jgi:sigma-B regulation protein RsbU (phosphoserine phosphatase)
VGGDLVDAIPLGGGRTALVLADVAGKGLGAALLMAKLQSTLRALAEESPSLADLGATVNRILRRDGLPNSFATLVYLEVEAGSGHVRVLNAGHMPPVLLHGAMITELQPGSIALGITHPAAFDEQRVDVAPGDTLLVYSDGVTEAMDASGELFGEDRLRELLAGLASLPPREAARRIVDAVDRFTGEARIHDDLSILVLRRA